MEEKIEIKRTGKNRTIFLGGIPAFSIGEFNDSILESFSAIDTQDGLKDEFGTLDDDINSRNNGNGCIKGVSFPFHNIWMD